jgi:DNA-directed RNA polymerase specialized sigma24 family protein
MSDASPAGLSSAEINAIVADDGLGTVAAKCAVNRFFGELGHFTDDHDEITQLIRIHIWDKLTCRAAKPPNIEAYVRLVAKRKALNLRRDREAEARRQARVRDALALRDDHSQPKINPSEFMKVLSALPDGLRNLCDLFLDGKTLDAVACALGISREAVRSGLNDLREPFLEIYETATEGEEEVGCSRRDTGNHRPVQRSSTVAR